MTIQQIRIQSVLGLNVLEFEPTPNGVTILQGCNGSGKSSTIKAIQSLSGGHDATLIHNGAEAGEIVLVLNDGTEVTKRITGTRSTTSFKHPEFGALQGAQGRYNDLVDKLAVNPVYFLTAPPKKQLEYFLEVVPLEVDLERLSAILVGLGEPALVNFGRDGIEAIDHVHKYVFELRTSVNTQTKEKRATATELARSLPSDRASLELDQASVIAAAETKLAAASSELATRREASAAEHRVAVDEITSAAHAEWSEVRERFEEKRRDLERQLAALDADRANAKANIEANRAVGCREADSMFVAAGLAISSECEPAIKAAERELTEARTRAGEIDRHRNTAKIVSKMETDADASDATSERLSAALKSIDAMRLEMLESIPIAGVEIVEGELYVHGVVFAHVNRAEQVRVALELAMLRSGELKLVCVDNLECLDSQSFEAFCERAEAEGLTLIVTRVSDDAEINALTLDEWRELQDAKSNGAVEVNDETHAIENEDFVREEEEEAEGATAVEVKEA